MTDNEWLTKTAMSIDKLSRYVCIMLNEINSKILYKFDGFRVEQSIRL